MIKSLAWFFLTLYVVVLLRPAFPLVDYAFNKEKITRVFCVNKDKPVMHCNGKCHLMKELKKNSEESPRSNAPRLLVENLLPHFSNSTFAFVPPFHVSIPMIDFAYQEPSSSSHPASVYHPPQC